MWAFDQKAPRAEMFSEIECLKCFSQLLVDQMEGRKYSGSGTGFELELIVRESARQEKAGDVQHSKEIDYKAY